MAAQMSELLGRLERKDEEVEISDEEWEAQAMQAAESWETEERKNLEREAQDSWEAAEQLRELLQKEEEEKALAAWAEEERKRKDAIADGDFFDRLFDAS
jgi:hypothetical protein